MTRYDERTGGELGLEKERARLVKVAISVSPSRWSLSGRFLLLFEWNASVDGCCEREGSAAKKLGT